MGGLPSLSVRNLSRLMTKHGQFVWVALFCFTVRFVDGNGALSRPRSSPLGRPPVACYLSSLAPRSGRAACPPFSRASRRDSHLSRADYPICQAAGELVRICSRCWPSHEKEERMRGGAFRLPVRSFVNGNELRPLSSAIKHCPRDSARAKERNDGGQSRAKTNGVCFKMAFVWR